MTALSFLTYSISAVWLTPYLYKHIGSAAYGLIPIAALFTQYVALITTNVSRSVDRFLSIELNRPDGRPNAIFNSALALYSLLILVQVPLFAVGLLYADRIFSIPAELRMDGFILLGCSATGFLISFLGGVFWVAQFARNRIDISSSISMGRVLARLVLVVCVFSVFGPRLRYIGFIDLGLQVVSTLVAMGVFRKLCPSLSVDLRQVSWRLMGPIFSMSFWSLLYGFGGLLFLRTDIWIINRFISPVAAGQYAAMLVVANFIRQLAQQGSNQLAPVVMQYWARRETQELGRLLSFSIRVFGLVVTVPISILCLFGGQVLCIWLGNEFMAYGPLLIVMVLHMIMNAAVYPLAHLPRAANSWRWPTTFKMVMGCANVLASYILGVHLGWGLRGVAFATAMTLTIDSFFLVVYSASLLKIPKNAFLKPVYLCLAAELGIWSLWVISEKLAWLVGPFDGMWDGAVKSALLAVTVLTIGCLFFLRRKDRRSLLTYFQSFVSGWS